jgi:hypothetical protein
LWRCDTSDRFRAWRAAFPGLERRNTRNHIGEIGRRTQVSRHLVFVTHLLDFFSDDTKVSRRADRQFYFVPADVRELDLDFVTDQDRLALAPLHHQHTGSGISGGCDATLPGATDPIESGCWIE